MTRDEDPAPDRPPRSHRLSRRSFLVGGTSLGAAVALAGCTFATESGDVSVDPWVREDPENRSLIPRWDGVTRRWLGPDLWGNRLQDWRFDDGRVECTCGEAGYELRTVAVLTREIVAGDEPGHLRVRTGVAESGDGPGFCGLLLGTGNGELDYRARALVGRSSGTGGGTLCTYETDGRVRFREHTDEANPVAYRELSAADRSTPTTERRPVTDDVELAVDVLPQDDDRFSVQVKAFEAETGALLDGAVRSDVPEGELLGGIALVSSPMPGTDGARWWFERLTTAGGKIADRPERTFGPVAGTLYSVNDSVTKLSAQLLPVGDADPETVRLRYRPVDGIGTWRTERTTLDSGYAALFRLDGWDPTRAWEYRVVYEDAAGERWRYDGRIDADPGETGELTVGLLSCTELCARQLDGEKTPADYSESVPERYTPENIFFPYETLSRNLRAHEPDLLVCVGDQVYEGKPTAVADHDDPELDYLYKWYLWLWSFGELTRNTPTIVLVDDHDVYQPMLWGSGGERATLEDLLDGGYVGTAEFVNRVQRIQCGHNPDPYDPTPTERGISVYYGEFTYGGTDFAILEDRKFKTAPHETGTRKRREAELLGERQERFLAEWADDEDGTVKVCLTQTCFASPLTLPGGDLATVENAPAVCMEANGFPKGGRDRAIELLRDAGALVLAGDLHLPMLLRHGLETHTDGVVQFVGPAGSGLWPRWFDPTQSLPNGRGRPNTGEFTDAFGNKLRMLAVANPGVSYESFERTYATDLLHDREKRPDGYGIVRIDHEAEAFVIECWPWSVDPNVDNAPQFPGWPYRLPFEDA